jgi:hypothetical protein
MNDREITLRRRSVLKMLAGLGVGTAVFQRALADSAAEAGKITPQMIQQAEWVTGLTLTEEERQSTAASVERSLQSVRQLREVPLDYDVPPALLFHPAPTQPAIANQRTGEVRLREC